MKISLDKQECLEMVLEQLKGVFPGFNVTTTEEGINSYGKTDFELTRKEVKND